MRDKNLLLFILLSALVMGGWLYMRQMAQESETAKKEKEAQLARNTEEKKEQAPAKPKEEAKPKEKDEKPAAKKEQPKPREAIPPTELTIGGEGDYYITAVLTSRGAGVRRLALSRFEAADWLGRPEPDKQLQLIQDDPFQPSFRMYHYPEVNDEHPVFGLGEQQWKLESTEKHEGAEQVTFSADVPGVPDVRVSKTYRLEPRMYHLTMTLKIQDTRPAGAGKETSFRYQLTGAHGLPVEGEWYTGTFRNAVVGLVDNGAVYRELDTADRISLRGGGDKFPLGSRGSSYVGYAGVLNQYFGSVIVPDNEQPAKKDGGGDFRDLIAWARPTNESTEIKGFLIGQGDDRLEFLEVGAKGPMSYRMLARVKQHLDEIDLGHNAKAVLSFYETPDGKRVATWIRPGHNPRGNFDDVTVRVNSEPIKLAPGQTVAHRYLLYHGPAKTRLLGYLNASQGAVDPSVAARYTDTLHLYTLTDYHTPGALGRFSQAIFLTDLIILFTRAMHWILWLISLILPSSLIGLSIILLTVVVRGLMFPISRRQALFSIKMQALAPELKKLSEKYKNDPAAKGQAVMELYRKHGVHPLGSCLPLLLQMPIFMGLYFALQESLQFRLAPFLWVPNLAAPDMLVWWTESIPIISDPDSMGGVFYLGPYFNILPIIAVVLMVIQQQLMTPPPTDEQQEAQQKMMKFMSIFFGFLFYKVAAGLCIYFISTNLWGLAERKLLPRKKETPALATAGAAPAAANGPPTPRRGPRGSRREQRRPDTPPTKLQKLKDWWAEILRQAEKK